MLDDEPASDGEPKAARSITAQIRDVLERQPAIGSLALTGLFVFAVFAVLYVASAVFIPLTLALMSSFALRPLVRVLERAFVPRVLAGTLVFVLIAGGCGYAILTLAEPAAHWVERMPKALRTVERKIRPLRQPVEDVSAAAKSVERLAGVADDKKTREIAVERAGLLTAALDTAGRFVGGALVMLIALYLMLISGDRFVEKLIRLIPELRDKERAASVMRKIEGRMSRYLVTVIAVNTLVGTSVGLAMYWLHMPNPLLWAVMAGLLEFVPYVGALAGITVVALASLVTFEALGQAMLPPLAYIAIAVVQGNVVAPLIFGRAFDISPIVIFVWLVLWGWIWGIAGALVAVPILTLIMITCEQSPTLVRAVDFVRR